jgi:hypothetical protein
MEIKREPQPVTLTEWRALPDCSLELLDGEIIDGGPAREAVLKLLLANVGLDQVVRLAPAAVWREALDAVEHRS